MNVDTVILKRKAYDELRSFRIEIERGNSICTSVWADGYLILSESDMARNFKKEKEALCKRINELEAQVEDKIQESAETIETLRSKSLLSVIKWKLKNN
jgi:hypothetical protein